MNQEPQYDAAGRPVPHYPPVQQQHYPQQPYGHQSYEQHTYRQTPQQPFTGRHGIPETPPERPRRDPWIVRHKVLSSVIAVVALLFAGIIGAAAGGGKDTKASPAPTVTVTQTTTVATPGPTVTATATVQATQNAQGEATQISDDGTYVIGQDIPGGTWHTSGGSQCYEATLSGTDTIHDIISNDNFTGPNTVNLSGAKAFDISGGCTWQQE
jgi:hypothetical protein